MTLARSIRRGEFGQCFTQKKGEFANRSEEKMGKITSNIGLAENGAMVYFRVLSILIFDLAILSSFLLHNHSPSLLLFDLCFRSGSRMEQRESDRWSRRLDKHFWTEAVLGVSDASSCCCCQPSSPRYSSFSRLGSSILAIPCINEIVFFSLVICSNSLSGFLHECSNVVCLMGGKGNTNRGFARRSCTSYEQLQHQAFWEIFLMREKVTAQWSSRD